MVLAEIRPLVDYLTAHIRTVSLRGRTFASVMRLARDWHASLAHQRAVLLCWPQGTRRELILRVPATPSEPRAAEWTLVELLDSYALAEEGRLMRHCVATYAAPLPLGLLAHLVAAPPLVRRSGAAPGAHD